MLRIQITFLYYGKVKKDEIHITLPIIKAQKGTHISLSPTSRQIIWGMTRPSQFKFPTNSLNLGVVVERHWVCEKLSLETTGSKYKLA